MVSVFIRLLRLGGAICTVNTAVVLESTLQKNNASFGGAAAFLNSWAMVSGASFDENLAFSSGGALYFANSNSGLLSAAFILGPQVSTFQANTASQGTICL